MGKVCASDNGRVVVSWASRPPSCDLYLTGSFFRIFKAGMRPWSRGASKIEWFVEIIQSESSDFRPAAFLLRTILALQMISFNFRTKNSLSGRCVANSAALCRGTQNADDFDPRPDQREVVPHSARDDDLRSLPFERCLCPISVFASGYPGCRSVRPLPGGSAGSVVLLLVYDGS